MDGLPGGTETVICPHCGAEMRRGMIRCRQCGKTPAESAVDTAVDFELTGHELVQTEEPRCALCGALLEPGSNDCPSCTSALLDQLLKGPENGAAPAPRSEDQHWPSSAAAELRVRRAGSAPAARESGTQPRETFDPAASPARAEKRTTSRAADAPRAKPVAQSPASARAQRKERPARRSPEAVPEPAPEPEYSEPTEEELAAGTTPVETSAACVALLASLAKADVVLRCEIATALGKLGDKQAMGPLERHMVDPDVRVRRAVAAALVQLGHPKGQSLLDIAERKPAKEVLVASKPPKKPRSSGGGSSIDGRTLKIVLGAILAVALVGGGAWYFWPSSSGSYGKSKKGKAAVTKKAPKKAPVRAKSTE